MQTVKHKIITVFALLIAASSVFIAFAPQASALTEDQVRKCYQDWNNKTIPNRRDPLYKKYTDSGCSAQEACGANTVIHEDPNRPIVPKCTNPDQAEYAPPGQGSRAGDDVECSVLPGTICKASKNRDLEQSAIWLILIWVINILTVGVGILAVGAIVYAGFLYATARDDSGQVKKSIEIITNTVIGLLIYVFMFAILNFLIPGGIFNAKAQTTELALIDGTERLEWRLT